MGAVMNCVFGYKRLPSPGGSGGNPRPEPRYWPAALKTRMNSVESAEEEATEELSLSFSASASSSSESLSATSLESGESSSPSKNNSLFPWKLRHGPRKKRT